MDALAPPPVGHRVLLVEDDYFIQDIYQRAFITAGYQVTVASDGEEGMNKALVGPYDIILLDIMLPKMTGIEVLRKLRDRTASTFKTPILLITNLGQEEVIKEAFAIGADGYLIKAQVTPADVIEEVKTFLSRRLTPVLPTEKATP